MILTSAKKILFIIAFSVLHWACHTSKEVIQTSYCSSIMLEKGGCLAKCKAYTIKIDESGLANYTGKANVEKTGNHYRTLSEQEKTELWEFIKKNDIFNFTGFAGSVGEDSQARLLVLVKNGVEKKISYGQSAPKVLKTLENKIEAISESGEWKKR